MEAVCLHPFESSKHDELPFEKGAIVKILDMDSDPNWYKAEVNGREGLVPKNYVQMKDHSWFVGMITRKNAEKLLINEPRDGSFLVRLSESSKGDFSLSVKFKDSVQHFKVLRDANGKYFLWLVKFNSLNELIEYHKKSSVSRGQDIFLTDIVKKSETPQVIMVEAIYDFEGTEENELSMKKKDRIIVLEKNDKNWWTGKNPTTQKEGLIPVPYIKELTNN